MTKGTVISLSAPNITFYKEGVEITQLTTESAEETFELEIAYQPTISKTTEQPTITLDILGHQFTFNNKISCRSLPETFAIVAKVGNVWYALPSQGLNSTTPPAAYPVEVDNMADPTAVTSVPASDESALMIMPGVAFDRKKNRVGYGGGFCDKYLEAHPGLGKLAVAFEFQFMDEVPVEPTDICPEMIITETTIY